ncbi:MAG: DUF881 domain-containing protein [Clostridiales bacterium]|jgi:uncharacterized protein YlxW (UPF0749 family)|nr:DUF881 domain-containing protein [Clostridiales bacterium]
MSNKKRKVTFNDLGNTIVLIMMILLGIVISMQIRLITGERLKQSEYDQQQKDNAIALLKETNDENNVLTDELNNSKNKYDFEYKQLSDESQSFLENSKMLNDEINLYMGIAGLTDVDGPGIEIRLDDANTITGTITDENGIVHDYIIADLLNVLKYSGAEAISVNDERIMPFSGVICSGTSITINDKRLFAPFVIKAIGDKTSLEKGVTESKVYTNSILNHNLLFDMNRNDSVKILKYSGSYLTRTSLLQEVGNR